MAHNQCHLLPFSQNFGDIGTIVYKIVYCLLSYELLDNNVTKENDLITIKWSSFVSKKTEKMFGRIDSWSLFFRSQRAA